MNHQYTSEIECLVSASKNVLLEINPELEASFDCMNCRRSHRSVIFKTIGSRGICTPRKKCYGFPGILRSVSIKRDGYLYSVKYLIDFNYEQFIDLKYNTDSKLGATWARINLKLSCPKCERVTDNQTQDNLGRPRIFNCECGYLLYEEKYNPFKYVTHEY